MIVYKQLLRGSVCLALCLLLLSTVSASSSCRTNGKQEKDEATHDTICGEFVLSLWGCHGVTVVFAVCLVDWFAVCQ